MSWPTPSGFTLQNCTSVPIFAEVRELIKCLFDFPFIGIAILDSRCRYLVVNNSLAVMNGVSVEFHSGKTVRQVLGHAGEELEPQIERVFSTGESVRFELTARLPKRSETGHWNVIYLPIRNLLGRVEQICAIVTEMSEEKALETSLSGLSRKLLMLKAIVDGDPAGDRDGILTEPVVRLLNLCISEIVAISKLPHSRLQRILQEVPSENPTVTAQDKSMADSLTPRECEVIRYLAEGKCNKEIAAALGLSVKTVETYRSRIMPKLGAHSLSDVTRFAVRHGFIKIAPA